MFNGMEDGTAIMIVTNLPMIHLLVKIKNYIHILLPSSPHKYLNNGMEICFHREGEFENFM